MKIGNAGNTVQSSRVKERDWLRIQDLVKVADEAGNGKDRKKRLDRRQERRWQYRTRTGQVERQRKVQRM